MKMRKISLLLMLVLCLSLLCGCPAKPEEGSRSTASGAGPAQSAATEQAAPNTGDPGAEAGEQTTERSTVPTGTPFTTPATAETLPEDHAPASTQADHSGQNETVPATTAAPPVEPESTDGPQVPAPASGEDMPYSTVEQDSKEDL